MKVYVASDHRGFELKVKVVDYLKRQGYKTEDVGDKKLDPNDDYPLFAQKAANGVLSSQDADPRAILICGSGQGMVIAANRIKGIRAGLGWSRIAAQDLRNDEDSNVLAIPAELYDGDNRLVFDIIEDFIKTPFAGAARYKRRIRELDNL